MVTDEKKKNTTDILCLKTEKDNEKPTSKAEELWGGLGCSGLTSIWIKG